MSVERRKDGSVVIRGNNGVTAVSKIGGTTEDKHEEKFRQWVEDCVNIITPCAHSFKETEQYFLEQCDALPLAQNDRRMKNYQCSVIMNYFKDKLKHQPPEFSFDMTDEDMEEWHKEQDAKREEAMGSSPEDFGLELRGYCLPHTEGNEAFYEETYTEAQKCIGYNEDNTRHIEMPDICFFFEETTGQFQASGGGKSLIERLIAFRGVTREDIKKRSSRFLGYISALREMGELE